MEVMRGSSSYKIIASYLNGEGIPFSVQSAGNHPKFVIQTPKGKLKFPFPRRGHDDRRVRINQLMNLKRALRLKGIH